MAGAATEAAPGRPDIVRVIAPNPGPMTLDGTNTYVVGSDPAWVIDPGPADAGHIEAVRAVAEERGGIGGVLITHSHLDHVGGVEMLGAEVVHGDPAIASDEGASLLAAAAEMGNPVRAVEPATVAGPSVTGPFTVVPTPGHAAEHAVFVLGDVCFCGDLILGTGSSIVPPATAGGSLADYLASLDRVAALAPALLAPGHGRWITDPPAKIAEYRDHRLERERMLTEALDAGERSREALLDAAWGDVAAHLRPAAALAMQAHLEKLAADGREIGALGA